MKLQQKTTEKLRDLINEGTKYRSGPILVSFFNNLGFNDSYGTGFPSRWIYTEDKLSRINGTPKIEQCIKQLLSPVNFIERFEELNKHILEFNKYLAFDGYKIVAKGKEIQILKNEEEIVVSSENVSEDEFINRDFKNISIDNLGLDGIITDVLKQRLDEIRKCLTARASLSVIFLSGSMLEGILLGIASKKSKEFNQSSVSPKDQSGKAKRFQEWTLSNFIDVAHSLSLLGEDVKRFSHELRNFRNYIHPYEQMAAKFHPDEHTAKICWQVLQTAIHQLSR